MKIFDLPLIKNRSLILRLAYKDITDRYAGSALGVFWTILQPLLLIVLYTLVFTFIFKVRIGSEPPSGYALYAIAGLLPWLAVADGLSKSISAVTAKAALVKQTIFPTDILPVSTNLTSFLPLAFGFLIYLAAGVFLGHIHFTWLILLLPVVMLIHFVLIVGIGYFLAIGGVYFRDLIEIISFLLTIGLFVTPILYLETSIPRVFIWPMRLNIFAHLIYMYRDIVFYGKILHPWSFVICLATGLILFTLGYRAYNRTKIYFANLL